MDNFKNLKDEIIFELTKPSKANLEMLKRNLRYFSELELDSQTTIIKLKQKLFSQLHYYQPMIDLFRNTDRATLDLLCLNCAIQLSKLSKTSDQLHIKVTHRSRAVIPRTLEYKVKVNLAEITLLREKKLSWDNIAKEMKHRHRKQFADFKLSGSYLRRTYNNLTK